MKNLLLVTPLVMLAAACQTQQDRSVATGALAGAALGAAVSDDDDRLEGAIIGGTAGAVAGALIGQANTPGDCVYQDAYGNRYVAPCQ